MSTLKNKAQSILDEKELKIIPENIKEGVQIFDVVGEYQGSGVNIDLRDGIKFTNCTFSTLPDYVLNANWSECVNMNRMFSGCLNLTSLPLLDTSNVTDMGSAVNSCWLLTSLPLFDTSKVTTLNNFMFNAIGISTLPEYNTANVRDFGGMCSNCTGLVNVPVLDTSNATTLWWAFHECPNLSDESLNNIMQMCINAVNYNDTKTLEYIGLTQEQVQICTTLSNWSACQNAGWSTGY